MPMKQRIELQFCIGERPHGRPLSGANSANDNIPREQELFEHIITRELISDLADGCSDLG